MANVIAGAILRRVSSYEIQFGAEPVVVVILSGNVNYATVAALFAELEELAVRDPDMAALVDETNTRPGLVGVGDIRRMMAQWSRMHALKRRKLAVVAPTNVMFGINRMARGLAGREVEGHIEVFRDRDAAMAWLLEAAETD